MCWVWVPSHEVGHKSNQTLIGYSHKFCTTIGLEYFAGSTDCRSIFGCVGVHMPFLVACGTHSYTKETRTKGCELHTGTRTTSSCSMSCMGVILCSGAMLSVGGEQPFDLAIDWVIWGIFMGPSWPTTQLNAPCSHNWKISLAVRDGQLRLLIPSLLGVLIRITSIDSRKFPMH